MRQPNKCRAPGKLRNKLEFGRLLVLGGAVALCPEPILAADQQATNAPSGQVLLLDNLGRVVSIPTNEVANPSLLPPSEIGIGRQVPDPTRGASTVELILQRLHQAREGTADFWLFPSVPPRLMPYLNSQDEFGNTAARAGALTPVMPFEPPVQGAKYWLSEQGLRYSLAQTLTFVNISDVMQGDNSLAYYTLDWQAKWAIFDARSAGTAGWISTQIEVKSGLGPNGGTQDARRNLGTITDPTGIWSEINGLRIPELAWQQSLRDGEVVVVAGMVSQGNYFDGNAYANSGRGQFINSALIDTMVMPLPNYNFGFNVQWQPVDEWYAMVGSSAGNGHAGFPPWTEFSWNSWSLLGEVGFAPKDFFGLGPGVYRVQPFLAQADSPTQGGIGLNFQQQLGRNSPIGWFGRFGIGGSHVTAGASAQVGTGFVMNAPLMHAGLVPRLKNDFLGLGFVWSQPSAGAQPVYHDNEFVFEAVYALQLSPMMKLQPDLQVVWNPAFNPDPGPALVAQIQFVLSW